MVTKRSNHSRVLSPVRAAGSVCTVLTANFPRETRSRRRWDSVCLDRFVARFKSTTMHNFTLTVVTDARLDSYLPSRENMESKSTTNLNGIFDASLTLLSQATFHRVVRSQFSVGRSETPIANRR